MTGEASTSWLDDHDDLPRGALAVVDRVLCWTAAVIFSVISVALIVQVVARYVVGQPTVWSEELALGLFVWLAMIAIPLGIRRGEHLTLDVLSARLPRVARKVLAAGICALTVITFLVIAVFAVRLMPAADRQLLTGIEQGLGVAAKQSWVYVAVPLGAAVSIAFSIERLGLVLRSRVAVLNTDADQLVVERLEDDMAAGGAGNAAPDAPRLAPIDRGEA